MSFSSFGFSKPILLAIDELGYSTATQIQVEAIPAVLSGKDVLATAQTGTGKTASFTLPLLQRLSGESRLKSNHARVLILTPTRELAIQVAKSVTSYGRYLSLKSAVACLHGTSGSGQGNYLKRKAFVPQKGLFYGLYRPF